MMNAVLLGDVFFDLGGMADRDSGPLVLSEELSQEELKAIEFDKWKQAIYLFDYRWPDIENNTEDKEEWERVWRAKLDFMNSN